MSEATIRIEVSRDEALVLFDWLARLNQVPRPELFEVQAEQRVLWNLEAILEKTLVEPFDANYEERLEQARARLGDP